jgi:hypothetical protein
VLAPAGQAVGKPAGALRSEAATSGGKQNILCACLSVAVLAGLGANALAGLWWPTLWPTSSLPLQPSKLESERGVVIRAAKRAEWGVTGYAVGRLLKNRQDAMGCAPVTRNRPPNPRNSARCELR